VKKKIVGQALGFYPLIFDWMEADLNVSCKLEVNKKKFVGLSRLID